MAKTVSLVTGIGGFIASHVADHLLQMGHSVVGIEDLSGGFKENIPKGCIWYEGSITDSRLVNGIFEEERPDYVFHLAAYAAEGLSHFIKRYNYMNNVVGSVNLINAAVNYGVRRFVFTSSIAVYGSGRVPFTEDIIPQPEDSYGIAKYAVEQELKASHEMFGLDYTIFRPHNVYGERQNIGDKYRNVVGIFMNQCLKGEDMTVFGDGTQQRAFTYIDDVAPLIAASAEMEETKNQTFNIGASTPMSVNELACNVREVITDGALTSGIKRLPARNEVKIAFSSHEKLADVFPHRPITPLKVGLQKMAAWVKQHGARESKPFKNIEITKNLPESWR